MATTFAPRPPRRRWVWAVVLQYDRERFEVQPHPLARHTTVDPFDSGRWQQFVDDLDLYLDDLMNGEVQVQVHSTDPLEVHVWCQSYADASTVQSYVDTSECRWEPIASDLHDLTNREDNT